MKELKLERIRQTDKSTIGMLYIGNEFLCYTLEPPWKNNEHGVSCIPAGSYPVIIDWSPKEKKFVPHIEKVPGRSDILIHVGNFPADTQGCVLVGKGEAEDKVIESRMAFTDMMRMLDPHNQMVIEVVDPKKEVKDNAGTDT